MRCKPLLLGLLSLLGAACQPLAEHYDLSDVVPGRTGAAEVRQRHGEPGAEFRDDDGGYTWEYSRQPEGRHCYMVSFDRSDRAVAVRQVLVNDSYRQIRDGMSRDEIRRLLGRPASIQTFTNLNEEVWEWHVEGDTPLEDTYFDVHFDIAGGGVRKTGKRVNPRG